MPRSKKPPSDNRVPLPTPVKPPPRIKSSTRAPQTHPGLALFALTAAVASYAQTAPVVATTGTPVLAQESTVVLSPFTINTNRETGWVASSTLVGSRTNEELANLPISVDAITSDFIRDLNAVTLDDAAGWVAGLTVIPVQDARFDEARIISRGMITAGDSGQSQRNFFNWYAPTDNYNVERIDFNKGSNSLMFGDSSPGGQATSYTKIPRFDNFGSLMMQYGSYDSHRFQLDVNRRLTQQVAVRFNAVTRSTRAYVDFEDSRLRAVDGAVIYRPFRHTNIRLEFEAGEFRRTRGDNQLTTQSLSAPGRGFSTIATRAFYTSDGEILLRSPNTGTIVSPSAGDRIAGGGEVFSLLQGQTSPVIMRTLNAAGTAAVNTNRVLTMSGFERKLNWHGVDEYHDRNFTNATAWVEQSVGRLNLEASFNQQKQSQFRSDTPFSNIVRFDMTGRPYVDADQTQHKEIGNQTKITRLTASYPFEFGQWTKQYVVASANAMTDQFHIFRWAWANVAVKDSGPPVPLANNLISLRAYLDTPASFGRGFWEKLKPSQLPVTPAFRAGLYSFTDASNPFWNVRFQKTYSISSSGQYLGGQVRTLLGVRYDQFKRKKTVKWQTDAYGNAIDPGGPAVAPTDAFAFEPLFDLSNRSLNGGIVYSVTKHVNLYSLYSESYRWQGAQDFSGRLLGPELGSNKEFGFKGNVLGNLVTYSVAAYQTDRENASFLWAPNVITTQAQVEDLFNPNNLLPSNPAYLHAPDPGVGTVYNRTTATERSRGFEGTLQAQRVKGTQARLTFSYNTIKADRDFSLFKSIYEAAFARTTAALAPGGNRSLAEDATLLANAKRILDANLAVEAVSGQRSRPYNVNWLFDYEFPRECLLKGTRLAVSGQWGSKYTLGTDGGVNYKGDASHPVGAYAIHRRKLLGFSTTFRLGVTNIVDLEAGNNEWRHTGLARVQTDGTPIYQYRYTNLTSWNLTTTIDF